MKYISVASGSSGNCHFIQTGKTRLIIDAGISGKRIEEGLNIHDETLKKVNGIFVTHEHIDHVQSVGVISRKYDLPIYATQGTWDGMRETIKNIKEHNIRVIKCGKKIELEDVEVMPFTISHDAKEPCGYTIYNGKKQIAVATDMGFVSDEVFHYLQKSDLAAIEANYDHEMLKYSTYPPELKARIRSDVGHLSNMESGFLACALAKAGTKRILLAHLSKENNMPNLAYQTVEEILKSHNISAEEVGLDILKRNCVSDVYTI